MIWVTIHISPATILIAVSVNAFIHLEWKKHPLKMKRKTIHFRVIFCSCMLWTYNNALETLWWHQFLSNSISFYRTENAVGRTNVENLLCLVFQRISLTLLHIGSYMYICRAAHFLVFHFYNTIQSISRVNDSNWNTDPKSKFAVLISLKILYVFVKMSWCLCLRGGMFLHFCFFLSNLSRTYK